MVMLSQQGEGGGISQGVDRREGSGRREERHKHQYERRV
jgi:hypothetical protein